MITKWFVDIANVHTFPLLAFLKPAVINFAVPSGGGHWVVQGLFVMPAAQALGADLGKAAMAIAYGEAWTNMAQPFWALPALAIAGAGVRDIMGYCVTTLLFSGVVFVAGCICSDGATRDGRRTRPPLAIPNPACRQPCDRASGRSCPCRNARLANAAMTSAAASSVNPFFALPVACSIAPTTVGPTKPPSNPHVFTSPSPPASALPASRDAGNVKTID